MLFKEIFSMPVLVAHLPPEIAGKYLLAELVARFPILCQSSLTIALTASAVSRPKKTSGDCDIDLFTPFKEEEMIWVTDKLTKITIKLTRIISTKI